MSQNTPPRRKISFWLPWAILGLMVTIFLCFIGYLLLDGLTGMAGEALAKAEASAATSAAMPTATLMPTATTIPTLAPTLVPPTATPLPTATKVPTIAPSPTSFNPYKWVGADVPYKPATAMIGKTKATGPAVCEWWDQQGFAFKATYDRKADKVEVKVLHEAMFFLLKGQSYTYPDGYVGTCWGLNSDVDVVGLSDSYRHLLFFSNVLNAKETKPLLDAKRLYSVPEIKPHGYMHDWLLENDFGYCTFFDQRGCDRLAFVVVRVPLGTSIDTIK